MDLLGDADQSVQGHDQQEQEVRPGANQGQRRGDAQVEEIKQGADIVLQDLGRGLRGPVVQDVLPPLRALLRHLAGAQAGFGVRRNRSWIGVPLSRFLPSMVRRAVKLRNNES